MTGPRVAVVTPLQRRIIGELTRDGATNTEIAKRLRLTPGNVGMHVYRICERCEVHNRTELVVVLLRGQLRLRVETQRKQP